MGAVKNFYHDEICAREPVDEPGVCTVCGNDFAAEQGICDPCIVGLNGQFGVGA